MNKIMGHARDKKLTVCKYHPFSTLSECEKQRQLGKVTISRTLPASTLYNKHGLDDLNKFEFLFL